MSSVAIIPARGGSKRIPLKNIKPFMGRPIIEYSVRAALESGLFDEVMVSTDDEQIAKIAVAAGAKVPFLRSAATSTDHAGLAEVIDEVLATYASMGLKFDSWCCILSTAPFVDAELLRRTFKTFTEGGFDTLRPVVRFDYPIQRAFRMDRDGRVSFMYPEFAAARSQDLEKAYHDSGLFYWGTSEKGFKSSRWGAVEIDAMYCQDIDTPEDWKMAELKYSLLSSK